MKTWRQERERSWGKMRKLNVRSQEQCRNVKERKGKKV